MLPFSIGGAISIRRKDAAPLPQTVQDEVASTLLVSGVPVDYLPEGGFCFRLGMVQHFSRTFLLGVSSGTVRCFERSGQLRIAYRLRFLHLLLLVSCLLFVCWRLELAFSPFPIPRDYYLVVWCWLVLGNILVTLQEFRRFLHGCARDSRGRVFFWRGSGAADTALPESAAAPASAPAPPGGPTSPGNASSG